MKQSIPDAIRELAAAIKLLAKAVNGVRNGSGAAKTNKAARAAFLAAQSKGSK